MIINYKRRIKTAHTYYNKIIRREERHKTIEYFKKWNSYLIKSKEIEENKLFNPSDLYYIKTLQ